MDKTQLFHEISIEILNSFRTITSYNKKTIDIYDCDIFNKLEYLSFLTNTHKIRYSDVLRFFDNTIIHMYDEMNDKEENKNNYREFRVLYKRIKRDRT